MACAIGYPVSGAARRRGWTIWCGLCIVQEQLEKQGKRRGKYATIRSYFLFSWNFHLAISIIVFTQDRFELSIPFSRLNTSRGDAEQRGNFPRTFVNAFPSWWINKYLAIEYSSPQSRSSTVEFHVTFQTRPALARQKLYSDINHAFLEDWWSLYRVITIVLLGSKSQLSIENKLYKAILKPIWRSTVHSLQLKYRNASKISKQISQNHCQRTLLHH